MADVVVDWPAVLSWRDVPEGMARAVRRGTGPDEPFDADLDEPSWEDLDAFHTALCNLGVVAPPLDAAAHLASVEGRALAAAFATDDARHLARVSLADVRTHLAARVRIDRFVDGSLADLLRSGDAAAMFRWIEGLLAAEVEARARGAQRSGRVPGGSPPPDELSVATWNVRHGGGTRRRGIAQAVVDLAPDLLVLPEWRAGGVDPIGPSLVAAGYHVMVPPRSTKDGANRVLVASRAPMRRGPLSDPEIPGRVVHAVVEGRVPIDIIGLYVPSGSGPGALVVKRAFLGRITDGIADLLRAGRRVIVAGDLNVDALDDTGRFDRLVGMPEYAALLATGLVDAFRTHHPAGSGASWWGPHTGRGFLLDHVLVGTGVHTSSASLHTRLGEHVLAGGPVPGGEALSDHALLAVRVRVE